MSSRSNDQGRAYEYITLITLHSEISKIRKATIVENSSLLAAKEAWDKIDRNLQNMLTLSAKSIIPTIFELEPLILEDDGDEVELLVQKDQNGEDGDVRDILIVRNGIEWEIGLSMKHNHFAVKHSRLSHQIDFGEKWYGHKCSDSYWAKTMPIFDKLVKYKALGILWNDVPRKQEDIYVPILNAFIEEVNRAYSVHKDIPEKMTGYLLGEYDYYKVISIDRERTTSVNGFNLYGTLNQASKRKAPKYIIPRLSFPTRIVSLGFKPKSKTTIELYMDNGWQFSLRLHSASSKVQPSLKFDVELIGKPATIISINCRWK